VVASAANIAAVVSSFFMRILLCMWFAQKPRRGDWFALSASLGLGLMFRDGVTNDFRDCFGQIVATP
jgi:hypothetical protein